MDFENLPLDATHTGLSPDLGERLYREVDVFIIRRANEMMEMAELQGITLKQVEPWRKGMQCGFCMAAMAIAKGTFDITELTEAFNPPATEVEGIGTHDN